MSSTFLLQDWVTIRSALTQVEQEESRWLDVSEFSEVAVWIDVSEVTPPGGTSTNSLQVAIESAPTCDEANFIAATPAVNFGSALPFIVASTTPVIVRSMSLGGYPISRYLRWRIVPNGSGLWDVTFRIRVVGIRSALSFIPTQISGCLVWFRGDLGITLNGANVSAWADQSGNANNASQTTGTAQPPYNPTAVSGLPAIQGDGSARYMTTPSITSPANITILSVVQPLATTQSIAARIVEQSYATSYFMGANLPGVEYKLIVANNVSPFGLANTGTVQLAPSLVSATYNNSAGSGTIYYNGAQPVSYPFSAVTGSLPLYIMRAAAGAASFWNGYIAEIIIYNSVLTPANLTRVHRYLGARYQIPVP